MVLTSKECGREGGSHGFKTGLSIRLIPKCNKPMLFYSVG